MRKLVVSTLFGVALALSVSFPAAAHEGHKHGDDKAAESTDDKVVAVQGELIDAACFVSSDGDAKGNDHAECAKDCMASGIPAGILPEGAKDPSHLMFLLTNPAPLAPYAAKTIKVEGIQHEDLHAIDVKKISVKDGDHWKEIRLKDEHHKMAEGAKEGAHEHKGHDHD